MKTLSIYPQNENINSRKKTGSLRSILLAAVLLTGIPVISYAIPDAPPVYVHGISQTLSVCQNSGTTSISSLLSVTDADAGQTETWSVNSFPSHGSLSGFNTTGTSGATPISPSGVTYRPNTGFSGTDVFSIQVSDGTLSAITTVTVTVNPLPSIETFTGGGAYCAGSGGVNIGLTLSQSNVSYQLYLGGTAVGGSVPGTGSAIAFGTDTARGVYHAIATDNSSLCTTYLTGVTVSVAPQPDTFTVTGGGSYCTNGTGMPIGLTGSQSGVSYQLYNDTTGSAIAVGSAVTGSGSALDFGLQTLGGNYTVVATNITSNCVQPMAGSAAVHLLPLPTVFNVNGGGTYCLFGSSVAVGLDSSETTANYQLYNIFGATGGSVAGTGNPITLGNERIPGGYTVIATSTVNSCTVSMNGSVNVNFSLPPIPFLLTITNNGNYCAGDTGVHIMLNTSTTGVNYQLYRNDTAVGGVVAGTGNALDYGPFTTLGTYKIIATSGGGTGCTTNMLNTVAITVAPVLIPTVTISTGLGAGNAVCLGTPVNFTAQTTYGGTTPTYTWTLNGTAVGTTDSTYVYSPVDGDVVSVKLNSNALCAIPDSAMNSMTINVDTAAAPSVFILATPAVDVAIGQRDSLTAIVTNGGPSPSYQWYLNGNIIPGATNASYVNTFTNGDSISCQVITSGGCGGVLTFNSVMISVFHTGIAQVAQINNLKLAPNPNKGDFTISGTLGAQADGNVSVEITNMLGQVIYKNKVSVQNGVVNERIQLNNVLPNGMYLLNFKSANTSNIFRFVIEQ